MGGLVYFKSRAFFVLALFIGALSATDVSSCQNLSDSGTTYVLGQSVNISGATCFIVSAANITLDCAGYSLTGDNSTGTYGVYSDQPYTTVKNCNVGNFHHAIYFDGATNGAITDTNASTTYGFGIYLSDSRSRATNHTVSRANVSSATHSIVIASRGNVLSGFTVDQSVWIIDNDNELYEFNAARVIIQGGASGNNIHDFNATAPSSDSPAIWVFGSSGNAIHNFKAEADSGSGVSIMGSFSQNNTIANATIISNHTYPLYVNSFDDACYNNTLISGDGAHSLLRTSGHGGHFYWNNFTDTAGYYIEDTGSNFYSEPINGILEGNIYGNVMSGEVQATGNSQSSGFPHLQAGAGALYNSSSSGGKVTPNVVDYAPLHSIPVCACGIINASGYSCILDHGISAAGATCLSVDAANVTIDCDGYSISGNNSTDSFGIYSRQNGTIIKNCAISGFDAGVYFLGASGGQLLNNSVDAGNSLEWGNYGDGIYLQSADYNLLDGNSVTGAVGTGIYIKSSANNAVSNSYARTENGFALLLRSSPQNVFSHISLRSQEGMALAIYSSSQNNFTSMIARAPAANAIYLRGSTGNNFREFTTASTESDAIYMTLNSNNNTFSVFGASSTNGSALALAASSSNTFANATFSSQNAPAVHMYSLTYGNSFINNTLQSWGNAHPLVQIEEYPGAGSNMFCLNNFTSTIGLYINDSNGGNSYNCTYGGLGQGNIYANVLDGSVNVSGSSASAVPPLYIGTNGTGVPYGSLASLGMVTDGVVDYAPLTPYLENTPPSISAITITPSAAYANSTLHCSIVPVDAEQTGLTVNYAWRLNGAAYSNSSGGANNSTAYVASLALDPSFARAGDTWGCSASASDGALSSNTIISSNVTLLAPPPQAPQSPPSSSPSSGGSGGSNGGGPSGSASTRSVASVEVDVGGTQCTVTLERNMESSDAMSVLTTTLANSGGPGCAMANFVFNDTLPSSFALMREISFSPSYSSAAGASIRYVFPAFAVGESKAITYSVARWVPASRAKNFTNYSMSASKIALAAQTVQPQTELSPALVQTPGVKPPVKKNSSASSALYEVSSAAPSKTNENVIAALFDSDGSMSLRGLSTLATASFIVLAWASFTMWRKMRRN